MGALAISPLPSLPSAFSRRAALFGVVGATGYLAAAASNAVAGVAGAPEADRQLVDLADEICTTLDGAAYALDPVDDDDDQDRRLRHADELILRMVDIPAVGLAGVLAKAKGYLDSASYDVMESNALATSLAEDAERVCGGLV